MSDGILTYTAAPGELNRLTLTVASGSFTLLDAGVPISAGPGCSTQAIDRVLCPTAAVTELAIDTGDQGDTISLTTTTPATIADGSGDDTVTAGSGADALLAGTGTDTLSGGSGNDTFVDGSAASNDVFNGGSGTDRVSYAGRQSAVAATIDSVANDGAVGELDNVRTDVEQLEGGDRGDSLVGSTSGNRIVGGYGDDTLNGGSGDDQLDGGPGSDDLQGGAGTRDIADYSARTHPVTASIDGSAGDGESNEGDDIETDIEGVYGGSAADRLTGGAAGDELRGNEGDDWFRGMGGADTMSGGGGQDTADYSDRSADLTVTIDGVANDAGESDNVGTDVDDLIGGSGDDRFTGSSWGQTLDGGPGDDTLYARSGNDTLKGDSGNDTLYGEDNDDVLDGGTGADRLFGGNNTDTADYSGRDAAVTVTLGDSAKGDGEAGEGDDATSDIEKVNGGAGADTLVGDSSSETFNGGPGDDRFDGGRGSDSFTGGDGADTLDYSSRTAAVTVDNDNSGDDGESGERDNARTDVEVVLGGSGNDRLTGASDASNRVSGGRGDDTLKGGGIGPDVLIGGDGRDTADYSDRTTPVYVSLGDGANDGQAWEADDVWGDVESVRGGSAGDRVIGNEGANTLTGNDGDDFLAGADGDDRLTAGDGEDVLQGGWGADDLEGGGGGDTIDFGDRFQPVTIDLDANETSDGDDVGDDIESATGGAADDRIVGGGSGSVLAGGAGNDSIDGGGGGDVIVGGDGADTADYSRRGDRVLVTLDGNADDGQDGERDNVQTDVEAVLGGTSGDSLSGSGAPNTLVGGEGDDTVAGLGGDDVLQGAAGDDELAGGAGLDRIEAGPGSDYINSRDGVAEFVGCGLGRDGAKRDKSDTAKSCEQGGKPTPPDDGSSPTPPRPEGGVPGVNVHIVRKRGKIVSIPGFPGERIDRRLLRDIKWLRAKYKIHVTDGYATAGHAPNGEHPIGLGLDIVPGPGGSWKDIDRLAKFAEPSQNRPRAPWRWVGYNGDANHGRGHHLHLSWSHAPARPGHTAAWVQVLTGKPRPSGSAGDLRTLARASNQARGGVPHVKSRIRSVKRCSGAGPLVPTWKAAAKSFGLRWQILAAITQVESAHGCNMGPSSAGAIGWTQFMPATWSSWGMDANGDGKASPYNSVDAIFSTARYLRASGAPGNYRRALFAYNHADWYVNLILRTAKQYKVDASQYDPADAPQPLAVTQKTRSQTAMSKRGLEVAPYLKPATALPPSADETLYPGARR